ncbi:MAG TPA: acetyl-coenzyme A synthetase N-terminal domain-containing protein [Ktedonobacteraceae bacterium]|nr:acetyl-coenzyme A synthetase N-terminal domain-containing protein [Ktedonobacteraceae bacterium]
MTTHADDGKQSTGVAAGTPSTADFQRLLTSEARFAPSPEVLAQANVKDYQALYNEAASNLPAFWDRIAREFTWEKPWNTVMEGEAPDTRWFVG